MKINIFKVPPIVNESFAKMRILFDCNVYNFSEAAVKNCGLIYCYYFMPTCWFHYNLIFFQKETNTKKEQILLLNQMTLEYSYLIVTHFGSLLVVDSRFCPGVDFEIKFLHRFNNFVTGMPPPCVLILARNVVMNTFFKVIIILVFTYDCDLVIVWIYESFLYIWNLCWLSILIVKHKEKLNDCFVHFTITINLGC